MGTDQNRIILIIVRKFTIIALLIVVIEWLPATMQANGCHPDTAPALSPPSISAAAKYNQSIPEAVLSSYAETLYFNWTCYYECARDCYKRYWCGEPDKYFNHCLHVCAILCTFEPPKVKPKHCSLNCAKDRKEFDLRGLQELEPCFKNCNK